MDDKLKVFWNLDILVKMSRSKSDGPSLRIEEAEIIEKINSYNQEIDEIASQSDEESYDSSAEMADRNIEIITKKQLQILKSNLKEKNKKLESLKEEEAKVYANNTLLKETKASQEKYIISMQERVNEATNYEVMDRYNALIAETTEKAALLCDDIEEQTALYEKIQHEIIDVSDFIRELEDKIDKKKKLLEETISNLEDKSNYIDKTKKEKNEKRITELVSKVEKLSKRLEELRKDPKYLESKIKDIINSRESNDNAKQHLITLINTVIRIPYINVPTDNLLEEELLKATQARDSFANEIDQKSYNILEADTPEKLRIEYLTERIAKWNEELRKLKDRVEYVDRDEEFHYEIKNQKLYNMINTMKVDLKEFQRAYEETPDTSISYKASLKAQIDEKEEDIVAAEKIATAFRKDESEDIAKATKTMKYECETITKYIAEAEEEIEDIRNRLATKKSGLIDITTKNKDKDTLKELAQIVIDIKHRRQFAETPLEVIQKLEDQLNLSLMPEIDRSIIDSSSVIVSKDYDEYTNLNPVMPVEVKVVSDINGNETTPKRGIKVINEATISTNLENFGVNEEITETSTEETTPVEEPLLEEPVESEMIDTIEESPVEETPAVEEITETPIEEPKEKLIEEQPIVEEIPQPSEQTETIEETLVEHPVEELPVAEEIPETSIEEPVSEEPKEELIVENPINETTEQTEDEKLEHDINELLNIGKENPTTEDSTEDETPLDIGAIIESTTTEETEPKKSEVPDVNELSISTMFSNTNNGNNDNIESNEDLTIELEQSANYIDQETD